MFDFLFKDKAEIRVLREKLESVKKVLSVCTDKLNEEEQKRKFLQKEMTFIANMCHTPWAKGVASRAIEKVENLV